MNSCDRTQHASSSLGSCATYFIDNRGGVSRQRISAPGDVAVGSHKHEVALVSLAHFRFVDRNCFERQGDGLRSLSDRVRVRGFPRQVQQREALAKNRESSGRLSAKRGARTWHGTH